MKYTKYFTILIIFSCLFSQGERSTIYYNGNPVGIETGNLVYKTDSLDMRFSNIFTVNHDYILERFSFYLGFESFPDSIIIQLQQDDNQSPGEVIDEWNIVMDENYPHGSGYNIYTLTECIQLDENSSYWVTLLSRGDGVLKWIHTDETWPNVMTLNGGENWSNIQTSPPGANIVYGEQIYYQDPIWGDVNEDLITNVIDVLIVVQHILDVIELTPNQFFIADLNQDENINVIDVLGIVNIILSNEPLMSQWLLEDINDNSISFGEMIGPEVYNGNISLYYFGKAG